MKNRNRWNNRKGFTMAELLLVVAIIVVLAALAFVGITRYLRSLHQMEMDNAAKQVFYAAQNRITAELNSGTLGRLDSAAYAQDVSNADAKSVPAETNIKMVVFNKGVADQSKTLWDEMLPFGAIDETVRAGGSYIITYSLNLDANMATVLDVWYASDKSSGIAHNWDGSEKALVQYATYEQLTAAKGDAGKSNRIHFRVNGTDAIIGHYGRDDATALDVLYNFKNLSFKLVNDEVLYGDFTFQADKIRPTNTELQTTSILSELNPQIKLTITGVKSEAKLIKTYSNIYNLGENVKSGNVIRIKSESDPDKSVTYRFILDNITKEGERFRDLVTAKTGDGKSLTGTFIPGEDIRVNVEVYSNEKLSNIDSASAVDNSLFQYVKKTTDNVGTTTTEAGIGKIRHLQNLSSDVSNVNLCESGLNVDRALQTADLDWNGFKDFKLIETDNTTKIGGSIVYNENTQTNNSFYPIDLKPSQWSGEIFGESYLTYDGTYTVEAATDTATEKTGCRSISNLIVNSVHAGLFGTVGKDSTDPVPKSSDNKERVLLTVQDLVIDTAIITGQKTAGAIIANEVNAVRVIGVTINSTEVKASNGNAGGVVGQAANGLNFFNVKVSGTSKVESSSNAGGLLGEHVGTDKHVHLGIDGNCAVGDADSGEITVQSTGADKAAGGLVGAITKGYPQIANSYSTALVTGSTAGGLIGAVGSDCDDGSYVRNCYVGGHVINDATSGLPVYDKVNFNITGTNIAGGFIGTSATGKLAVSNSYTTASTKSTAAAGGFYGFGADIKITNCYATGLVKAADPTKAGAFSGTDAVSLTAPNYYFELVNPNMSAVVGQTQVTGVSAVESSLDSYTKFFMLRSEGTFFPYNNSDDTNITSLKRMFGTRYFLPTVKDLNSSATLNTHIGDWQPVDTLIVNTPGA